MAECVIYAAKSTEDKKGSIPTQLEDCRAMAEREGWDVLGEFQDEGFSAYHGSRGPGLEEARRTASGAVTPGSDVMLVAQHSDRFARGDGKNAQHLAELMFWALKAGVQLRTVQDDSTFTNPLLTFAMGERNAEDSRRKSLSVKAGMKRRSERGLLPGGPRPYGYRWDGAKGEKRLVVVRPEAKIVERMFRDYAAGKSQQQIQRELNAEGVKTATGKPWYQGTIAKVLANPIYHGRLRDGTEAQHDPIVTDELWTDVERLRGATARTGKGRAPNGSHLFVKGHLRCGRCGGAMVPRTTPGRPGFGGVGKSYEAYRCLTRIKDVTACDQEPVPRAKVDTAVFVFFQNAHMSVDAMRERVEATVAAKLDETRALRQQAETEAHRAAERLTRVKRDYQDGKLDADDWREQRGQLTEEADGAIAQAQRLAKQEADIAESIRAVTEDEVVQQLADLRAAIAGHLTRSEDVAQVRAALRRLEPTWTLIVDVDGGGLYLRADALDGETVGKTLNVDRLSRFVEAWSPLTDAENKYAVGFPSASKFTADVLLGPIPLEVAPASP